MVVAYNAPCHIDMVHFAEITKEEVQMAKVNDVRGNAPTIELGGKVYSIVYDLNSFAELEKRFGSINKALNSLQSGQMQDVRTILWAGIIHEEVIIDKVTGEPTGYNVSPYQVGSWVRLSMLNEISEKIAQAIKTDLPDVEDLVLPEESMGGSKAPNGVTLATVVLTEEEKAEQEKNG